jgi:hypothetical protein
VPQHAFAGSAPNLFLVNKMAQFGRGTFTHIADINEIRERMARLLDSIESPVLHTSCPSNWNGLATAPWILCATRILEWHRWVQQYLPAAL